MPALFKKMAKSITKKYLQKGYSPEDAESYGYGAATNVYKRQHNGASPMGDRQGKMFTGKRGGWKTKNAL